MRNYKEEFEKRVAFLKELLENTGAKGFVFGNSGGKDSALVGILCRAACENTLGVMLPCGVKRNFEGDIKDAEILAEKYGIKNIAVDLTKTKESLVNALPELAASALANIAPRLRMASLYAVAAGNGMLVAGTGNKSEYFTGYFTKWGDGAYDFNVISDLTVTEIYEFLRYLDAPASIIEKAPSGALFEGQTDEREMGVSYADIDAYIGGEEIGANPREIITRLHKNTAHKREMPIMYGVNHIS